MDVVARIISNLIQIYILIVIVRCILSFVQPNMRNPIVQFIREVTDPPMEGLRKTFPFLVMGGLDLSPIALIFLVRIVGDVLIGILR